MRGDLNIDRIQKGAEREVRTFPLDTLMSIVYAEGAADAATDDIRPYQVEGRGVWGEMHAAMVKVSSARALPYGCFIVPDVIVSVSPRPGTPVGDQLFGFQALFIRHRRSRRA